MTYDNVIQKLHDLSNPDKIILKEKKFAIVANNSLGIYHKDLKDLAKQIGKNNELALQLFDSNIYEARILCSKIYRPEDLTEKLMQRWVGTFENWEICDSFCMGFFAKSEYALLKSQEWVNSEDEFVKRAAFTIMAAYGFANKNAANEVFESFLSIIEKHVNDERVYVKKSVNWALRNIGKRNVDLHKLAVFCAHRILKNKTKSAQWIAKDALRELEKDDVKMLNYPRVIYKPN